MSFWSCWKADISSRKIFENPYALKIILCCSMHIYILYLVSVQSSCICQTGFLGGGKGGGVWLVIWLYHHSWTSRVLIHPHLPYHLFPTGLCLLCLQHFCRLGEILQWSYLLGTKKKKKLCRIMHSGNVSSLGTQTIQTKKIKSAWSPADTRIPVWWSHLSWKNNTISSHGDKSNVSPVPLSIDTAHHKNQPSDDNWACIWEDGMSQTTL